VVCRAKFSGLIAIRQAHGFLFGKSDMFFCCGLTLQEGSDIGQQLKACVSTLAVLAVQAASAATACK
jgi:hypothetical protein